MLSASFGNFLAYHDYPVLRPEILLIFLGLVALAAVFAWAHSASSQFGQALLDALLVYLAVDLNSSAQILAGFLAMVVAFARLGRNLSVHPILTIISLVVLASSLVGFAERRAPIATVKAASSAPSSEPAVLHLVLDEQGGVGGATDAVFRKELADFYTGRGFRLFERAYSRHLHTVNAIPDVLNFGNPGKSRNVSETLDIGPTAYLSKLERNGYRLNFYQSDFADFCRYSRFASCTSYWSPSASFLTGQPVSAGEKARLLGLKFAALSELAMFTVDAIDAATHQPLTRPLGLPVMAPKERAVSGILGGLAVLDAMAGDLRQARPGNAYFAHVLAPHYPYAVSADCRLKPPSTWHYRRSSRPVAARKAAYREQVRCVLKKLDRIIAAFEASPAGKTGVILIHGDHGSRITALEPAEWNRGRLGSADLMAGYSTLFAVRAPGITRGTDKAPYATPDILRQLATTGFASLDGLKPGSQQVHLTGLNWTVGSPVSIAQAWPDAH